LTCLRGCGLVVAIPQGRRTRYELADERLRHALTDLLGVVLAVDGKHHHQSGVVLAGRP
jgi:DNA-binding transcriptional ArsR family regulator